MLELKKKFEKIAGQLDENILAVKGTLELVDTSVTEDELHQLLLKSIDRMDMIQGLSNEMLVALEKCFEKMGEINK